VEAVKKLQSEILAGPAAPETGAGPLAEEGRMAANAKKIALLSLGVAYRRYLNALEEQQEILGGITGIAMNAFAMESVWLRARKLASLGRGDHAADVCAVFARESMESMEATARTVLAGCAEGHTLRTNLAILRRFTKFEPAGLIALRRRIAQRLLDAERYIA